MQYKILSFSLFSLSLCLFPPTPFLPASSMQPERPNPLFSLSPLDSQESSLGSCRPHSHVMFLKTHKTASSTVLNMLYRFGDEAGPTLCSTFGVPVWLPIALQCPQGKRLPGTTHCGLRHHGQPHALPQTRGTDLWFCLFNWFGMWYTFLVFFWLLTRSFI